MDEISKKLVLRIDRAIADLQEIAEELRGGAKKLLLVPGVAKKFREKVCLKCGLPIEDGNQHKRGVHSACYQAIERQIEQRITTLDIAIAKGELAPKKLAMYLRNDAFVEMSEKEAKSQQDIAIAKHKPRKSLAGRASSNKPRVHSMPPKPKES